MLWPDSRKAQGLGRMVASIRRLIDSIKNKQSFITIYVITGAFCLVWSAASLIKELHPAIYDHIARGGLFIWFCYYVLLPFVVLFILDGSLGKSYKADIAYLALSGACEGYMCVEWIPLPGALKGYLYAIVVIFAGACGFAAGIIQLSPVGYVHSNEKLTAGDIVGGVMYGFVTATALSAVFPHYTSGTYREMSMYFFYGAMAIVSATYPFVIRFIYKRREREYLGFKSELDSIISRLVRYDKEMERFRAERAAHEKAERERREQNGNNRQGRADGGSRHSTGQASWEGLVYFKGCNNKTELKRRYRQLCKKLHPDCGGSAESFRKMQKEYDMISSRMAR